MSPTALDDETLSRGPQAWWCSARAPERVVVRSGGMKQMFTGVYAPAALGPFLREFTHGHTLQLASVARAHLVSLAQRTDLLADRRK